MEFKTTTRQVVKLFDASGVTRFSTFQIEFDPLAEQLYVNTLRVIDGDGKEVAFGKPSDYYVIDDAASGVASSRKLLGVPVPGLQPGYTIEIVFTRRDLAAPDRFPFNEHYFAEDVPILRDSVFVRAPANAVLSRSSAGISPRATEGGQIWSVETPPVYHFEPMQAPLDTFMPYLLLGSPAQNWAELAREYLKSIADRLEIEPSARTLAEQTVSAASNDDEKAQALARLVRDQLTYKAIEFGRRARAQQGLDRVGEPLRRLQGSLAVACATFASIGHRSTSGARPHGWRLRRRPAIAGPVRSRDRAGSQVG